VHVYLLCPTGIFYGQSRCFRKVALTLFSLNCLSDVQASSTQMRDTKMMKDTSLFGWKWFVMLFSNREYFKSLTNIIIDRNMKLFLLWYICLKMAWQVVCVLWRAVLFSFQADMCNDPLEIYKFMYDQNIGCELSVFFEGWTCLLEQIGNYKKADTVYQIGIKKNAQPLAQLKSRHE